MADIIELRRGGPAARPPLPERPEPAAGAEPWLLPWAMFQLGVVAWANWWFLPLGLRVERSEPDRPTG